MVNEQDGRPSKVQRPSEEMLNLLTDAYREANGLLTDD